MKKVILASLMSACVVVGLSSFTVKHDTAVAKHMVADKKDLGQADDKKDLGQADNKKDLGQADNKKDLGQADAHRRSAANDKKDLGQAD
jgi:hypothetical protein